MKDTHVFTAVCGLALLAIVSVFIGYATDTLPQQKQRVITTSSPSHQGTVTETARGSTQKKAIPKKDCHCCSDRMEKLKEHLREMKASEAAAQQNTSPSEKSADGDSP